jgi:hypothetical protein
MFGATDAGPADDKTTPHGDVPTRPHKAARGQGRRQGKSDGEGGLPR